MKTNSIFGLKKKLFALTGIIFFSTCISKAQTIQFSQLNFDFGGPFISNSDWGAADLTFTGSTDLMYFNLTKDTSWVVENIPVMSVRGPGVTQTLRFWFPIGTAGVQVNNLNYGFSLTPDTVPVMPPSSATASVASGYVSIRSGAAGSPGTGGPLPAATKQKGWKAPAGPGAVPDPGHQDFPNQDCELNECVPAAISNSLQWLNQKHNLGMQPADISKNALVAGLEMAADGVISDSIVARKNRYCKQHNLPIRTERKRAQDFKHIGDDLKAGKDVELIVKKPDGFKHMVAVVGWLKIKNGTYALTIVEDSQQGCVGGTVWEPATYDRDNGFWDGALTGASPLQDDFFFVVESKGEPEITSGNQLPGGTAYASMAGSNIGFGGSANVIRNFELGSYSNSVNLPVLGNLTTFTFSGNASLEFSADSGESFLPFTAPFEAEMGVNHYLDSAGTEYFYTELTSLSFSPGALPANVSLRLSQAPEENSKGQMSIKNISASNFEWYSFFDVFFEISLDGGASWLGNNGHSIVLELKNNPVSSDGFISTKENTVPSTLLSPSGNNILCFNKMKDGFSIGLYSITGQLVYQNDNYQNDLSVDEIPAGIFIYKLQTKNNFHSQGKIVVVK